MSSYWSWRDSLHWLLSSGLPLSVLKSLQQFRKCAQLNCFCFPPSYILSKFFMLMLAINHQSVPSQSVNGCDKKPWFKKKKAKTSYFGLVCSVHLFVLSDTNRDIGSGANELSLLCVCARVCVFIFLPIFSIETPSKEIFLLRERWKQWAVAFIKLLYTNELFTGLVYHRQKMDKPGGSESMWDLYGFSLCLRMYSGKIKSHRLLHDLHILNIWISKKNMPPPNPKPSASFLIHHLARRDEFSWSFIPPRSCRILDEFLMSAPIYQLAFQHMTVLLPNVLPFGLLQSKLITVRLLQISVSSRHVYLDHRSRSKNKDLN